MNFIFYTKKDEPLTNGFATKRGGTGNSDAASFDNDFYLIIRIFFSFQQAEGCILSLFTCWSLMYPQAFKPA